MGARDASLNLAIVLNYGFGLFFSGVGILIFTMAHLAASGFISAGFFGLGYFFLSVARVKLERREIKYRRFFRWHAIAYTDVRECGESWVFGYIRPHRYAFPWGSIYFARPTSSDSLFGYDREIITDIRSRANIR